MVTNNTAKSNFLKFSHSERLLWRSELNARVPEFEQNLKCGLDKSLNASNYDHLAELGFKGLILTAFEFSRL